MTDKRIRILYLDDEVNNLYAFKATFRRQHEIYTASNVLEARKILNEVSLHIIIADQKMPGTTGIEFFNSIKEKYPDPVRILLTGYSDIEDLVNAINKGQIYRYIKKPWDEYDLQNSIRNAYEIYTTKKELETKIKELEKTNSELSRFIDNSSHNIHAPLLSALGIINLAKSDHSVVDPNGYVNMIETNLLRVDAYIQRIMEYYQNVKLQPQYDEIDFKSFVDACLELCRSQLDAPEIKIQVDIQQEGEFYGDVYRIGIVLKNVLLNAMQYQKPGRQDPYVGVSVKMEQDKAILEIEDNGIGIPEHELSKIFKIFGQVNGQSSGTGMGLYIVKEALARMNGEVSVVSKLGQGSKFIIIIPNQNAR